MSARVMPTVAVLIAYATGLFDGRLGADADLGKQAVGTILILICALQMAWPKDRP